MNEIGFEVPKHCLEIAHGLPWQECADAGHEMPQRIGGEIEARPLEDLDVNTMSARECRQCNSGLCRPAAAAMPVEGVQNSQRLLRVAKKSSAIGATA